VAGGARRATRPKPLRFRLKPAPSCASELGGLDGASFAYAPGAPAVLSGASLALMRGDRVGVVGDNGSGKSTMLQLLLGHLTPTAGTAGLAPRAPAAAPAAGGKGKSGGGGGLRIFYYSQNSADALDGELTLVEAVRAAEAVVQTVGPQPAAAAAPLDAAAEAEAEASIHRTLVRMQFARGTHERRVRELSGGERARLLLCALVRCRANLVVLDEPTNHLDIETVEMVEEALRYFDGTLLVASHDRFFIAQTTRTVVALSGTRDGGATADAANGGLRLFAGGWTEYTAAADAAWRGAADAAAAREADGATDAGRFVGTRAHAAKLVTIDGRYFDERGRQLSQRKDVSDKRVRTQGGLKAMKLAKRAQVGRGKMAAAAGGAGAGKAAKK
jgi:ATP-binding cassette subfamily F protein uup